MKKPKQCDLKCNGYRKKRPYCIHCYMYTDNEYDPIMAPIPKELKEAVPEDLLKFLKICK